MALTRYGDYPMASYTGLTDITVPLYNVVSRKLSMPITMSFHASGRMANEINGILGMRWTLNCGGLVTRTMKGYPDEWDALTPFNILPYDPGNGSHIVPPFDVLYSACPDAKIENPSSSPPNYTRYDTEFDIFNYSLPNGKSGHFILKNVNGAKVAMVIPYDALKIETFNDQYYHGAFIGHIKITDTDGTQYFFGKIDASTGNAVESNQEMMIPLGHTGSFPTGWYLTKILSSDETDQIALSYSSRNITSFSASQSANVGDRLRSNSSYFVPGTGDSYRENLIGEYYQWHFEQEWDPIVNNSVSYITPTLSGIQFNGGSVAISYNTVSDISLNNTFASEIVVNRGSQEFKKIKFNLLKPPASAELYFLNDVYFYGTDQTTAIEKYNFSYYDLDRQIEGVFTSVKNKDWWGYYKNTTNLLSQRIVPITKTSGYGGTTQDVGFYNVTRDGSEFDKKVGMLKSITYPTGGQTEFVYEGNKYGNGNEGPGLRMVEVNSKPINGVSIHKLYKYGINENGNGFINEYLRPGSTSYTNLTETDGTLMHYWYEYFLSPYPVDDEAGFRNRNYYSDPYISFDLSGSPIKYDAITEYYLEDGNEQQKTQTSYKWGNYQGGYGNPTLEQLSDFNITDYEEPIYNIRKFSNPENAWLTPVQDSKIFYKYSNGQFTALRKELYNYRAYYKDEALDMPTYLQSVVIYAKSYNGYINGTDYYNAVKNFHNINGNVIGYGFRKYTTGTQMLYNTTIEEYTPYGTITTLKDVEYDDTYHFVKSEQVTNSQGKLIKTTLSYPHDFSGTPVYQQMLQRNILAPVIEKVKTINSVQTEKLVTNYYSPLTNMYVPQSVEQKIGSNPQETIAKFNNYNNKGSILEQQREHDIKVSYIYDYNSIYPIAEVKNSSVDQIASTSFEAEGKGNWTFAGTPEIGATAPTGRKYYLLSSGSLSKTVTEGKSYIISYWRNVTDDNPYSINGISSNTRSWRTVGGWTYFEHRITANSSSISISGGGYIDEVRLYPADAQMTTYTYEALIGMTSQCDANNIVTYYEYDNFNRLKHIKDQNGNIIKKICYNYAGQPGDCSASTEASWLATGNLTCEIGAADYTGYQLREERDANPASATYNQTRWVNNGLNEDACPRNCVPGTCEANGPGYRCVYGTCETGYKVYTGSYYDYYSGYYICIFHYEWGDGMWSQNYEEYSYYSCW